MTDKTSDLKDPDKNTVGIIGDGQLGMLLCLAAPALHLDTVILTNDRHCAAAMAASSAIEGAMDDADAVASLISRCDVITYEREDVPVATIAQLRAAEAAGLVSCFPPLSAIEILQDKAKQKRWLAENDLATLPFVICDGEPAQLEQAGKTLGFPLVQKALRGGFDGRGVQLLRDEASLQESWPGTTMLEQFAGDFREIAVLVVRGRDGQTTHFGPVDMTFETDYSVLDTVSAPAKVSEEVETAAVELAYRAVEALDGVGVFGVEMFLLAGNKVFINEIAPRVHNSGHYTIEACKCSQFEQHLRAVAGLELGDSSLRQPAAMRNILCTPALKRENVHREAGTECGNDAATIHWYGKSPARLMRKLGHITAVANSTAAALSVVHQNWERIQEEALKP
ncbi:5-(carboxyamino)imidazole ribonucleotide synthase [Congregibacter variabilis]|uniref:N5-carboxyaminoimidazole ribonucleotide synthase n=1 Tax=Congregibacter variabilis TaxID=3081200 RepID=A0ABZ0I5I5_9GAMM|nr:5-(carboxyamino)imidazole ribonucleotide synthase [Congregibacter sp. IMCC43200]